MTIAVVLGILIVGAAVGAFLLGKRQQRANQIASVNEAKQKMAGVRDSSSADTVDRMRDGDF